MAKARERCWRLDWVLDLDIKAFFDSLDWELMLAAVRRHTNSPWVLLYIERWLKAPVQMEDGSIVARTTGTPQGGVISPLLANLFLHHAFDMWMAQEFPHIPFERYADDAICHCRSEAEARVLQDALAVRLAACKLTLHPEKTCIVYCKDVNRKGDYPDIHFDFLGFQFRARKTMWTVKGQRIFAHSFQPAASPKALVRIGREIRRWARSSAGCRTHYWRCPQGRRHRATGAGAATAGCLRRAVLAVLTWTSLPTSRGSDCFVENEGRSHGCFAPQHDDLGSSFEFALDLGTRIVACANGGIPPRGSTMSFQIGGELLSQVAIGLRVADVDLCHRRAVSPLY